MSRSIVTRIAVSAFVAGAVLLSGQYLSSRAALAAELPASVKALIAGAKREGEVNIYGRTLKPAAIRAFNKRINAFYGIDVKLNMAGGFHTAKAAEVQLAIKKGAPTGIDVFWTSYATSFRLERAKALTPFDWSTLGIAPALKASKFGVKSHDVSLCFVSYNTNLVKDADAPKSWDDLLDPKWRGRIAMPRSPATWIYVTVALGEEKTARLLNDLMHKQQVKRLAKFSDVRTRVANGEFAIGIGTDAFTLVRKGAPIKMAKMDPMGLSNWAFYMMKDIENPNLAKLWAYWVTTADGQKALAEVDGTGFTTSTAAPLHTLVDGVKIGWLTRDYMKKNGRRLIKKYAKMMKIR
jgi:iron(III) transport system substrate-binding protein